MARRDNEGYSIALMAVGTVLVMYTTYCHGYPFFHRLGLTSHYIDLFVATLRHSGMKGPLVIEKLLSLFLFTCGMFFRSITSERKVSVRNSSIIALLGISIFLAPTSAYPTVFILTTLTGFVVSCLGISLLWKHFRFDELKADPLNDTFRQCEKKLEDRYSINIPMEYQWKGKKRKGWINVVNPFRATMIIGTPGSGKSYSVYGPYIEQMVRKGYSLFVYDYKYPDLTKKVYNEVCANMGGYKVKPEFYTIDFDHPLYSHRCNPMAKRYINDPADSAEIADIIMLNVCPGKEQKNDFFDMSAKVYLDGDIYTLSQFEDGRFCTFAHLVELTTKDYKDVLRIQSHIPELEAKVAPFLNALTANAQDQLQGQIASATIPISRFASPDLYWVLSGDDFSMDINDPEHPKIICVGNNPDRQEIYGTTLALYVSRLCKTINKPGKLHSGVLLDELPTIFVKGLDNLVNTARSNKVAVVLGAQDKSQLVRDYGQKNSDVVFNTVGNIFAGQVNGKTAVDLSRSFGREFRERTSQNVSTDSESENRSLQLEDRLPVHRIETLSPGYFCGKVQDSNEKTNDFKFFCGKIIRPDTPQKDYWSKRKPTKDFEDDYRDEIMANFLQIKADVDYMVRTLADRYGIELEEDRKVREAMEKIKEAEK